MKFKGKNLIVITLLMGTMFTSVGCTTIKDVAINIMNKNEIAASNSKEKKVKEKETEKPDKSAKKNEDAEKAAIRQEFESEIDAKVEKEYEIRMQYKHMLSEVYILELYIQGIADAATTGEPTEALLAKLNGLSDKFVTSDPQLLDGIRLAAQEWNFDSVEDYELNAYLEAVREDIIDLVFVAKQVSQTGAQLVSHKLGKSILEDPSYTIDTLSHIDLELDNYTSNTESTISYVSPKVVEEMKGVRSKYMDLKLKSDTLSVDEISDNFSTAHREYLKNIK